MKKLSLVVLFINLIVYSSYSQWKETAKMMPTANAASLGTFGEIPVSYFTGVPSISIPLYEVSGNKIGLPISLNYHAAGIRPDIHPGWVGTGWSLNAGGVITRTMKRMPDEYTNSLGNSGFLYNYSVLNPTDWSSYSRLSATWGTPAQINTDTEPDEFNFSFLGYSGKFFLDHTGQWRVQCNKPIQVIFDQSDLFYPFIYYNYQPYYPKLDYVSKAFFKFTIIDEKGNKYTFGGIEDAIEYSDNLATNDPFFNPLNGPKNGQTFVATSWYLTKVESADGMEVINFTYERGPYNSFLFRGYNSMYTNASDAGFFNPGCLSFNEGVKTNGRITSPVYLSSIVMPSKNTRIDFSKFRTSELTYTTFNYQAVEHSTYGDLMIDPFPLTEIPQRASYFPNNQYPGTQDEYLRFLWLKLTDITISNTNSNQLIKKITFNYTDIATKRLELNSISVKDRLSQPAQSYQFSYNQLQQPDYLTVIGDHWGFNNNASLPQGIANYNFDAIRQPNFTYLEAGVLERITYPTGGNTFFEYEIGTCSAYVERNGTTSINIVPMNSQVGGLRVKKITSTDNVTNSSYSKEYFYVKGYTAGANVSTLSSSGILDSKANYSFNYTGIDVANNPFNQQIVSSNPTIPVSFNSSGMHNGYSEVVEKRSDGSYTIYKFTNHDNGYTDVFPYPAFNRSTGSFIPYSTREFERGQLTSKIDYNNSGQPVAEQQINYTRINPANKVVRAVEQNFFRVGTCPNATRQAVSRAAYLYYYYNFVPSQVIEKMYPNSASGPPVTVTKDYTYDDFGNVLTETSTKSTGDVTKIYYTYPSQLAQTGIIGLMVGRNMVSDYIEKRTTIVKNGVEYMTSGELHNYFYYYLSNGVYIQKSYVFESAQPVLLSSVTPTTYTSQLNFDSRYNSALPAAEYDYDIFGNISFQKSYDIPEALIWDSWYRVPVARVINANETNAAYSSFENYSQGNWTYNFNATPVQGGITGKLSYQLSNGAISRGQLVSANSYIISYWTKPGASISVSGTQSTTQGPSRNGWQYWEKIISGVTSVSISGSGNIDEVRLYPRNSQMISYTYDPLIGLSSMCDVNNSIVYYEYDNFNRLKNIRDYNGNIIQNYCYNYTGTPTPCNLSGALFYNTAVSVTLSKQCSTGQGTLVTYSVPAGKWSASTQVAADGLAQTDLINNGQAYANANGTCREVLCSTTNCNGFDLKCINGYCERAVKKIIGWYACTRSQVIVTTRYTWSDGSYIDITTGSCDISTL